MHDIKTQPRNSKSGRLILAGAGPGWSLWVPAAVWEAMSEQEQRGMVARQAALMDNSISKKGEY